MSDSAASQRDSRHPVRSHLHSYAQAADNAALCWALMKHCLRRRAIGALASCRREFVPRRHRPPSQCTSVGAPRRICGHGRACVTPAEAAFKPSVACNEIEASAPLIHLAPNP